MTKRFVEETTQSLLGASAIEGVEASSKRICRNITRGC